MAIGKKKKVIKRITDPDELMAAMSDVYSTPFGNVGQEVVYQVDKSVLDNAGKARYWEGYEIVASLQHAKSHPRDRLDTSAIQSSQVFPADYVKPGTWNYQEGKMDYPTVSVSQPMPKQMGCLHWTLLFGFGAAVAWAVMTLVSSPLDYWLTGAWLVYVWIVEPAMWLSGMR